MKYRRSEPRPRIFTGSYDPGLAERVAADLHLPLDPSYTTHFSNTEIKTEIPSPPSKNNGIETEAIRGDHVFIIQSHGAPVNETLMEHAALINAAKRGSAAEITAIMPYRGYGRADRPDNSHESFMGPLAIRLLLEAGADNIIEIDPHSGQSAGFLPDFRSGYTAIPAHPVIDEYVRTLYTPETVGDFIMVAPDSGRAKTSRRYAERHGMGRAIVDKLRTGTNLVETSEVVGDVVNRHCIMIDDMFDTAGTIIQGAQALRDRGASEVSIIATHGILSGPAIERITVAKEQGVIGRIAVTDTLKLPEDAKGLIDVISVVPLISTAIKRVYRGKSVSKAFDH